ncbi:hypothetical protein GKZ68_12710 [Hymenobacter sp. BRD128]|uniref:hypothetical protein n=1 Tax=Hymenobacter sp. BRD128 TaxID=2675878 RepID=UPI0015643A79|nr:hypothetical protein [Hymenobacter sp. BRD128]QKG57406.1 hypothetical protein GKZ68_12710 [Hymenobacter sp. BRD128]
MKRFSWLATLAVAVPLAAAAQTKPTITKSSSTSTTRPATQEVKETVEELDPATGKVIRRTTRTYNVPAGTAASAGMATASPASAPARTEEPVSTTPVHAASDPAVSSFLREKVALGTTTAPQLLRLYNEFIETVRAERSGWKAADWDRAAAVLSSLNARYEQLRPSFTLDDKLTIRSQQGEFQTLRTARQLSDQISNKL